MSLFQKRNILWQWLQNAFFVGVAVFLTCFAAWASGISVPANSRLDVNSGQLNVELDGNTGTILNAGTIMTTTGVIRLNGDWTTVGVGSYIAGAGTVVFTGTAGTQTLVPGNVVEDGFYNLTHSGAGTVLLSTLPLDVNGTFWNSAGTFDTGNLDINVAGNWSNYDPDGFIYGTSTVSFDGGNQTIVGDTIFYNMAKQLTAAPSSTLTFTAGSTQNVMNILTLQGFDLANKLFLRSSVDGTYAFLQLDAGGGQDIRFVDVKDNNASGGLTLIARNSTDSLHNVNWLFGSVTIKWDGSVDTNWNNPLNWDLGLVPTTGDTVIIRSVDEDNGNAPIPLQPVLTAAVQIGNLETRTGSSLTTNQRNLTVENAFVHNGNLIIDGNETVTTVTLTDNGTFTFVGMQNGVLNDVITQDIVVNGSFLTTFYNLTINEENIAGQRDTFTTDANVIVTNDLTVTEGAFSTGVTRLLAVGHDLTMAGGTFTAGANISVANDATVSVGTFDITTNAATLAVVEGLTVSGGTLNALNGNIDVKDVSITLGTLSAPGTGKVFTVSGNFDHAAAGTFTHNNGLVTLDGTSGVGPSVQIISGSTAFYDLTKDVLAGVTQDHTLTFTATTAQSVAHSLTLRSLDGTHPLFINSSSAGNRADLNLLVGGGQNILNVDVIDNNAAGVTLVARGPLSHDSLNNLNWIFGGTTVTWDGSESTDWNNQFNWDLGMVPMSGDAVIIPNVARKPHLTGDVTGLTNVADLTLQGNAELYLDGYDLEVLGPLSNDGSIFLYGDENINITTFDTNSGAMVYQGNGDGAVDNFLFTNGTRPATFFNLTINDGHATPDTFTPDEDLVINGSITVNGGTLDLTAWDADVAANIDILAGTLVAPTTGNSFTVGGNFSHTAGATFTANNGLVTLDGSSAVLPTNQILTGNTTFYDLSKVIPVGLATAHQLTFDAASIQTVTHLLSLQGLNTNNLLIRSTIDGDAGGLRLMPGGAQILRYLDVKDSDASGGGAITLVGRSSLDSLGNTNWIFGIPTVTWTGGALSSNWDDPYNWDLGFVPLAGDDVVIAPAANQPDLTGHVGGITARELTIQTGATLTLGGTDLTVTDTLSNEGTGNIILRGDETVSILHPDPNSGTFTYTGDNSGSIPLNSFGPDGLLYFNLVLADSGGVADTFLTQADLLVNGNLTVTAGTLDVSTGTDTLSVGGDLFIGAAGTVLALNGNVDVNGGVTIGGTLSAPGPDPDVNTNRFTVGGSWTLVGGTFTTNNGRVTFDSTNPATITGNTTFYDFKVNVPNGKAMTFEAGSAQTVQNDFIMLGSQLGRIVLTSDTPGTKWDIVLPAMKIVTYVDVQDSRAIVDGGNSFILAFNSIDRQDINNLTTNEGWAFGNLLIIAPGPATTVGPVPVIVGQGVRDNPVYIVDKDNAVVATALCDANGNFRVVLGVDQASLGTVTKVALDLGVNSLRVMYGVYEGELNNITVVAAPTDSEVPVITSPEANMHLTFPTFKGRGKPGADVKFVVNDDAGFMLLTMPPLTYAGTGVVEPDGTFTVTLTVQLPSGINYVSVLVGDGAALTSSAIYTYVINDIRGVVFDSSSNNPLNKATVSLYRSDGVLAQPGVDIDAGDVNPVETVTDGVFGYLTNVGSFYVRVEASGYTYPTVLSNSELPVGRSIRLGSRGEVFPSEPLIQQDQPLDATPYLFKIEKDVNKSEAKVGEVVTYTVTIESQLLNNNVTATRLYDIIPPGFKFMSGRAQVDGLPIADPTGNRPLSFDTGTFTPQQAKTLRYQLVVGTGVAPGSYENVAYMRYDNGRLMSNKATESVKVVMDQLFDVGTVFGKVFYDLNDNGRQDDPDYIYEDRQEVIEGPVANVRIVMEDGTIVTTDKNGQFHVPGLLPGRHILKVDERTLPKGAYVTNDKAQVVDVTAGSVAKVNFGINMDNVDVVGEDQRFFSEKVRVDQTIDQPKPRLNVDMFNPEIKFYNDAVLEQIEFKIFMNYVPFIQSWRLDVIDKDTKRIVKEFSGTRYNILDPILWDGRDGTGRYIRATRNYAYVLKVEDGKGGWSDTKEKSIALKVLSEEENKVHEQKKDDVVLKKESVDRSKRYFDWVFAQSGVDALANQTIFIRGETIMIDPQQADIRQIRVMQGGEIFVDVPVLALQEFTARDVMEGSAAMRSRPIDIILPNGDYELAVVSGERIGSAKINEEPSEAAPSGGAAAIGGIGGGSVPQVGSITRVANYVRPIKIGEDYMTFVALGDGKLGYNVNKGSMEPVQAVDKYQPGFYREGKMAYYLKGKVKGKYIVTSSFDTERKQKEMFRSVKDDQYYPVYGDSSQISYDATNTQGNLFLLVEWDKSQAIWGNYAVDFKNTEFAQYTRTLYGGKIDYTSVATNPYGDARTNIVLFNADVHQRSAHNEFLGTGGSLYYMKHQDIVSGSMKISLQVRDAVTGLARTTTEMKEGVDYDIDYGEGRILFWQPVSMSADSGTIISNNLLSGDPIYVVSDYEYVVKDKIAEATRGARVQQGVGKSVVVGTTLVSETQAGGNYQLQGQDVTVHVGKDTTVKAEYAETTAQDSSAFVSTDGGITFTELAIGNAAKGKAYGMSQDSRLFDRLGLKSYYKWIENDFTSAGSTSQQGKEMKGLAMTFDLTPVTRLTASHDVQKLIAQGNLQTQMQVGAQESTTTVLQIVHDARRLKVTGEFRRQQLASADPKFATGASQDTIALQAEYDVDEKTGVKVAYQVDPTGTVSKSGQATAGVTRQLTDKLSATLEESFGSEGSATKLGMAANVTPRLTIGTDFSLAKAKTGEQSSTLALTGKGQVNDKTAIQTTYSMTSTGGADPTTSSAVVMSTGVDVAVADAKLKAGLTAGVDGKTGSSQGIVLDATKSTEDGYETTSNVKVDETAKDGRVTTLTLAEKGKLGSNSQLVAERALTFGQATSDKSEGYKIVRTKDGKNLEGGYARKYAENQTERSASNIFGLTGDINDRWAANVQLEQGRVQNIDGTVTNRIALSTGAGYLEKNEDGTEKLKSSTKFEVRLDKGTEDKEQFLISQATEGKISDETTLTGKFEYSQTRNRDTKKTEAQYKEIVLGAAYRPIAFDRLNLFSRYTYKEDMKPSGQLNSAGIEGTKMQVLSAEGAYELTEDWQIVERLAYRIMEEKVAGFDFAKTHTWLLVNRANYRINEDWKVGAEYRVMAQKEAKDKKSGFLVEAVRSVNDNVELGVGYNFTDFVDDLTDLGYTIQGPYIRMTGKLYDRTPEEKARARQKWIDRKVELYAWKMVAAEFNKKDGPVVLELNRMYRIAAQESRSGKLDKSRQIYKDVILATQMMYEEAAQFVRKHIAFEEKLFNAYQRAEEYYDKGELWMARKVWEKIVEEAQRSMLE